RSESADGLRRLALQRCAVLRLGLPDGGLRQCQTALQDQLQAQLSPTDTLLTTWRGDAHPDHESCGLAAAAAARSFGCRLLEAPVWLWHWSRPGDRRVPWERLVGLELAPDVVARKASALAAHRSQLTPRDAATGPVLGLDMVRRAGRPTEYFFAEM
ncbi:MAG: PIG-L family deacetylase, partial [Polaromonas sp.]|nr:PIG-L family deacetylase [Polaromonas sp.]